MSADPTSITSRYSEEKKQGKEGDIHLLIALLAPKARHDSEQTKNPNE